jgi:hypothetical protein
MISKIILSLTLIISIFGFYAWFSAVVFTTVNGIMNKGNSSLPNTQWAYAAFTAAFPIAWILLK